MAKIEITEVSRTFEVSLTELASAVDTWPEKIECLLDRLPEYDADVSGDTIKFIYDTFERNISNQDCLDELIMDLINEKECDE